MEKAEYVKVFAGLSLTAVSACFGTLFVPLVVLTVAMAADYLSGMVKAWVRGALSSKVGVRGIAKKLCYLLAVAAGVGADYVLALAEGGGMVETFTCPLACMVALWFIVNELISILENLRDIGVPLPKILLLTVNRLKDQVDKTEEAGEATKEATKEATEEVGEETTDGATEEEAEEWP